MIQRIDNKDLTKEQLIKLVDAQNKTLEKQAMELEELKKNVIVPKFNVGQEVYSIKGYKRYFKTPENCYIRKGIITGINLFINSKQEEYKWIFYVLNGDCLTTRSHKIYELFATREEAEEALRKLEEK